MVRQILDFLPLLTDKFGKSQLNHCMKLTGLMIDLIQLQIVAPTILNAKDVKENAFLKRSGKSKKIRILPPSHGKRMISSSLLKSNNALLRSIRESLQDDGGASEIPPETQAFNTSNLPAISSNDKSWLQTKIGTHARRLEVLRKKNNRSQSCYSSYCICSPWLVL